MKKQLLGLSLLASCMSSSALAAGPVANIQVTGDIKPPTCTVNGLEQNDVIFDYSAISPAMVPQSSVYKYPKNTVSQEVTITCDAKTYLTFKSTDAYESANTSNLVYPATSSSGAEKNYFNIVSVSDIDMAMGGAFFTVNESSVDGNTTVISRANDGVYIGSGQTSLNQTLIKQATTTWTQNNENNRDPENLTLIPGQVFSMRISNWFNDSYGTFITSKNALTASGIDISNGLDFMGEAVLTFNFGV